MTDQARSHPVLSLLLRMFWTFFGGAALVLVLARVAYHGRGELSWLDGLYGGIALGMVLARFIDVRYLEGETADGERRATLRDWMAYSASVLGAAGVGWLALRALTGGF